MTGPEEKVFTLDGAITRLRSGEALSEAEHDEFLSAMIGECQRLGIPWKAIGAALGVDAGAAKAGAKKLAAQVKRTQAAAGGEEPEG